MDPASILEQIELQIANVKEESFSRKEILEKVEKWLTECEEESWLKEYNRDDNRYNAGRGAHLTLKRTKKARNLVNKMPGMVEALASKTMTWESKRGTEFLYDGIHLLSMRTPYYARRKRKKDGGSGIRRNCRRDMLDCHSSRNCWKQTEISKILEALKLRSSHHF